MMIQNHKGVSYLGNSSETWMDSFHLKEDLRERRVLKQDQDQEQKVSIKAKNHSQIFYLNLQNQVKFRMITKNN